MITFNYQGRQLQGWKVESINTARGDGTDTLYYAEADGTYYLERFKADEQDEENDFLVCHRLSLAAAILWGVVVGTNEQSVLRLDAAKRLRAGQDGSKHLAALGWMDAHVCGLVGKELAEEKGLDLRDLLNGALRFFLEDSDAPECPWSTSGQAVAEAKRFRLAAGSKDAASELPLRSARTSFHPAGSMEVSIHLAPPVARMVQVVCDLEDHTPASLFYLAAKLYVGESISQGDVARKGEVEALFEDHHPEVEHLADGREEGPLLLRLDAEAAEKLRAYRRITARELEDIATGAVMLSVDMALDNADQTREPDWYLLADEVEEAAARRLEAGTLPATATATRQPHLPRFSALAREFALEPFFLSLFDAFCGRWDIEPALFVRAAVQEKLEEVFGDEAEEYHAARSLREAGTFDSALQSEIETADKVRMYTQAGLDVGKWLDGSEASEEESEATHTLRVEGIGEDGGPGDIELADGELTLLEQHARAKGMDFQEAFCDVLRLGLDYRELLVAADEDDNVPVREADLPPVEDADDAPFVVRDLRKLPAADRPDLAVAAAAKVEPLPDTPPPLEDGEDDEEQSQWGQPQQKGAK